ncbi:MAG: DUF5009 domain-containing protein, partial [Gemmatimonadaceae bacterium]|nr:DUF5009 domain-containing protein [Gemmatimonadaceae bacterium]
MRERLVSLDVFRGTTIAGMLLVNNPGTWGAIYAPLEHAEWHGWTPTDLIFPFFLFIVGITTHISLSARRARGDDEGAIIRQIIKRGAIIFLLGFLMSWFPFYQYGAKVPGFDDPTFMDRFLYRLDHVRIMGVLARIGVVYIASALLTLKTTLKQQVIIVAVLLYGYWLAMTLIPLPTGLPGIFTLDDPARTLEAVVDQAILGKHIWGGSTTFDPEGLMSTFPAIGTAILGVFAGRWINTQRALIERIAGLFAAGSLAMVLGLIWNWSFPINKSIWTSSYVLFTAGMACATLATCMWIIDHLNLRGWTKPFVIYGMNPIVAFVGSGVLARIIYTLWKVPYNGKIVPVQAVMYQSLFASWLPDRVASLGFALLTVVFWFGVL